MGVWSWPTRTTTARGDNQCSAGRSQDATKGRSGPAPAEELKWIREAAREAVLGHWLLEEGIASTARVDPLRPSNHHRCTRAKSQTGELPAPPQAALVLQLQLPRRLPLPWIMTSAKPLLDLVMFSMHNGMPALRAMWQRLALIAVRSVTSHSAVTQRLAAAWRGPLAECQPWAGKVERGG